MFILISIAAIIAMSALFSPSTRRNTHRQKAYTNRPMPASFYDSSYRPQEPVYSPDGRDIWDPYRRTWVRPYSFGDLVMHLCLGFAAVVGLLYYLGFIQ